MRQVFYALLITTLEVIVIEVSVSFTNSVVKLAVQEMHQKQRLRFECAARLTDSCFIARYFISIKASPLTTLMRNTTVT